VAKRTPGEQTVIALRYPDKPERSHIAVLDILNDSKHIAQSKLDGWRCLTVIDESGVSFMSRSLRKLPVNDQVKAAVKRLVLDGHVQPGTVLDGEWLRRRPGYEGKECLYLFSPLVVNGAWIGHRRFCERWTWLLSLGLPIDQLTNKLPQHDLLLPAWSEHGLKTFYEQHIGVMRTEGVVVYSADGQHHGSVNQSLKVRDMVKIKWREGAGEGERA
jgi:ATP-dependent DNA ligase